MTIKSVGQGIGSSRVSAMCTTAHRVRVGASGLRVIALLCALLLPAAAAAAPTISTLTPSSAAVGASITIAGTAFGSTQGTSTVKFNGTSATATSWSSTSIVATVPSGATTGNVVVTVSGVASAGKAFTVVAAPSITTLTPTSGAVGASVTIAGTAFGATQGSSTVKFNGTTATATTWSATSIVVSVPAGAMTGNVVVHASGVDSAGKAFTVVPTATISSLAPATGAVGASVTIAGANFGATQGTSTVKFNGTAATIASWSATSIVAPVPSGATTGNVVVRVGGVDSGGSAFTVIPAPAISTLTPSSGAVTTPITIAGSNFGATQGTSTVKFNGTTASITSWSASSIVAAVPAGATTGNVVVHAAGVDSAGKAFTVLPSPAITSLTPSSGGVGATVTIAGSNFGATQGTSTVKFNGTAATVTSWSATSLTTTVPVGASSGNVIVHTSVDSNGSAFTVVPTPTITTLSPSTAAVGAAITITGTNFGATQGTSTVKFNGTTATATSWSASSIVAAVPTGATTGNVVVRVGGVDSGGSAFTVVAAPSISTLTPSSGAATTPITIAGSNFGATQGTSTVKFNGTTASITSWSASSIVAPVPAGATTGNVVVHAAGVDSAGKAFTVLPPPAITSLTPSSGGVGATVTIAGSNFGSTQGTSTVKFNGTLATVTSWSATSLTTTVPAGASTGPVVVTVAGVQSAGTTFTVPQPPTITGASPSSASAPTAVTISGNGFGASQGTSTVKFNGTTATASSWAAGSITAAVPSAATSGLLVVTVGGIASNNFSFTVPPNITSISPDPSAPGAVLTVAGTNFGATKGTSTIAFNGQANSTTSWNATQIKTNAGAPGPIVVTVNGVDSVARAYTLVPAPSLWAVLPDSAAVGSTIAVEGQDFGAAQGASTIKINGTAVTASLWGDTRIEAVVPSGTPATGNVVVTVGGVNTAPMPFTVIPRPSISSLSVSTGVVGTAVTVTGTHFGDDPSYSIGPSTLTFNGTVATPITWSDTSISSVVPLGATTGPVLVTVGVDVSNSLSFTVPQAPNIQTISPAAGSAGASVSIFGSAFGATQGTSTLKFNGTTASVSSWTATLLAATVPAGATTGPAIVTVGGIPSNAVTFTVTGSSTLTGTITNQVDGTAVSGALVQVRQLGVVKGSATANATGGYSIGLAEGSYDITVTASGFGPKIIAGVDVRAPSAVVNAALAVPGSISGVITQSDGTTPIPNALVLAFRGLVLANSGMTDTIGHYALTALGADSYRVEVIGQGFIPSSDDVVVAAATASPHDVSLYGPGLSPINYAYDEVGRLIAVIDRGGDAAVYQYDAVGNILAIERHNASHIAIIGLAPTHGIVGTSVEISGTAFGPTPADNIVRFNGVAAAVTAASATLLTAVVPSGATTGAVSVAAAAGSASSTLPFTVASDSGAPTITSFSPAIGESGLAVTVTGTNFGTMTETKIRFNTVLAPTITSISPTSLTVTVPGGASSGRITVTTPNGQAVSNDDFFVSSVGSVGFTGRAVIGGSIDVPLSNSLVSLVVFDGAAGQRVTFGITYTGTPGACGMRLVNPDTTDQDLGSSFCSSILAPPPVVTLPETGAYTLRALLGNTGTATITVYAVPPDLTGTLTPGGPPINMATVPGQQGTYTFTGTIGTDLALTLTNSTYATCWMYVNAPNGSNLVSSPCASAGYLSLDPVQSDQPYTVIVQPWNASAGGITLTLLAPVTQAIEVDGPEQTIATTVAGQSAQFAFTGSIGQRIAATATADSFPCTYLQLVRPNGTIQASALSTCAGTSFLGAEILTMNGTYSVLRDPMSASTGSITMRVVTVPADVFDTAVIGGPAKTLTTMAAGQNATLAFDATAGQSVTIQVNSSSVGSAVLTLRKSDGTQVWQSQIFSVPSSFSVGALSDADTYTLTIDPPDNTVGSITIALVTP